MYFRYGSALREVKKLRGDHTTGCHMLYFVKPRWWGYSVVAERVA